MLFINNLRLCQPESWQEENSSQVWMRKNKSRDSVQRNKLRSWNTQRGTTVGGCVHPLPKGRRGRSGGRWSQGEGLRAEDHRSCQQRGPQQGDVGAKRITLSLHTPSDLHGTISGARTEGRRQSTPGDPAPRSSPGGAMSERGWLWRTEGSTSPLWTSGGLT